MSAPTLVTLGMFIIDTFSYQDADGHEIAPADPRALEVCSVQVAASRAVAVLTFHETI